MSERPEMLEMILATRIITGFEGIICAVLLLLNTWGTFERFRQYGFKGMLHSSTRKSFFALYLFCLIGGSAVFIFLSMNASNFVGNEGVCPGLVSAVVCCFVTGKQMLFLFLYFRAKIVHDALRLNGYRMVWLRRIIWITLTFGIPASYGWTFFVVFLGKVAPEGPCILYSEVEASIIAFAVCDLVLSTTLVSLFVVPIYQHSRELGIIADSTKLHIVIRRNFIASLLVNVTTLCGLISMVVILSIVHGKDVDPRQEHLQILATLLPSIELTFTLCTAHLLTKAWLPDGVRSCFASVSSRFQHSGTSSTGQRVDPGKYDANLRQIVASETPNISSSHSTGK